MTTATQAKPTTFTLTRFNFARRRHELATFAPGARVVEIVWEGQKQLGCNLLMRPYRELVLPLWSARRLWSQLRRQGWKTKAEDHARRNPTTVNRWTGD